MSAMASGSRGESAQNKRGVYFFDDRYGDHSAAYIAVDPGDTPDHFPGYPARLTCDVALERTIWAIFRRQRKTWLAPAGTYCALMGRWTDGTVRLQLGLDDVRHPGHHVSVDGRFPEWVVEVGGTRPILPANIRGKRRSRLRSLRPVLVAALLLSVAVLASRTIGGQTTTAGVPAVAAATVLPTSGPTLQTIAAPLIRATITATALPTASVPTEIPASPEIPATVRVANTNGLGVYLRRSPAFGDRIRAYPEGTELRIAGDEDDADGVHWIQVVAPDGLVGWVPGQYVDDTP